jgi:hypothetical protein
MTWLKFLTYLCVFYLIYYVVNILMDIMKGGPAAKLASGDGEVIHISAIEEDHQPQIIREQVSTQESSNSSPIVPAVVYEPPPVDESGNIAAMLQPVVAKGFDLKELAEQFKAGAIQATRDIAFQ